MTKGVLGVEQELSPEDLPDDDSAPGKAGKIQGIRTHLSQAISGETLRSCEIWTPVNSGSRIYPQGLRDAKNKALQSMRHLL